MITLVGPLAHPLMQAALHVSGQSVTLPGQLVGGARAGIDAGTVAGAWPQLGTSEGQLTGIATDWTPMLRRYADIMGLEPVSHAGHQLLGVVTAVDGAAPDASAAWPAEYAAAMADWLLEADPETPAAALRQRLPRIGDWVAARLRAQSAQDHAPGPSLGPDAAQDAPRFEILSRDEPYAHFFAIEDLRLRHRLYKGGWSQPLARAVFVSGDAAVVLPWDPWRDRVLLIDQFRVGPAARGDDQPWLYEAIAGRLDQSESPEDAARREAVEEAGVTLRDLLPAPHHYPSPGAISEKIYLFLGIAELPDGITGIGGLASEDEDIRSHLIPRAELIRMADQGEIRNGPLLVLALWLERHADALRAQYTAI